MLQDVIEAARRDAATHSTIVLPRVSVRTISIRPSHTAWVAAVVCRGPGRQESGQLAAAVEAHFAIVAGGGPQRLRAGWNRPGPWVPRRRVRRDRRDGRLLTASVQYTQQRVNVDCPRESIMDQGSSLPKRPRISSAACSPPASCTWATTSAPIKQHIDLQDEGECFYFIANYHALTTHPGRRATLARATRRDVALDYLALGLDPAKAVFFRQSDVPEVTELAWILATVTNMGLLERAVSYKEKVDKGIEASVGLFTYPVLMAADILIYRSNIVPVGKDQVQHLEMTQRHGRQVQPRLRRGLPDPDLAARQGIEGARHRRPEDEQVVRQHDRHLRRGQAAREDGHGHQDRQHADGPAAQPGHVQRLRAVQPVRDATTEKAALAADYRAGKIGYGGAKKLLKDEDRRATSARSATKRKELAARPDTVEDMLRDGAKKARAEAETTMELVRRATGLR